MSIVVSKTVKIGPKGFLNDVLGRKNLKYGKKIFIHNIANFIRNKKHSGSKNEVKGPKIRKTAKNRYSAQFYIRKYSENAHLHGNGFKNMFLPIKILEPRFF